MIMPEEHAPTNRFPSGRLGGSLMPVADRTRQRQVRLGGNGERHPDRVIDIDP
jgi:hypothetical protein